MCQAQQGFCWMDCVRRMRERRTSLEGDRTGGRTRFPLLGHYKNSVEYKEGRVRGERGPGESCGREKGLPGSVRSRYWRGGLPEGEGRAAGEGRGGGGKGRGGEEERNGKTQGDGRGGWMGLSTIDEWPAEGWARYR